MKLNFSPPVKWAMIIGGICLLAYVALNSNSSNTAASGAGSGLASAGEGIGEGAEWLGGGLGVGGGIALIVLAFL